MVQKDVWIPRLRVQELEFEFSGIKRKARWQIF